MKSVKQIWACINQNRNKEIRFQWFLSQMFNRHAYCYFLKTPCAYCLYNKFYNDFRNDAVIDGDRDGCDEIDGSRVQRPPAGCVICLLSRWLTRPDLPHHIYVYHCSINEHCTMCCIVEVAHTCAICSNGIRAKTPNVPKPHFHHYFFFLYVAKKWDIVLNLTKDTMATGL